MAANSKDDSPVETEVAVLPRETWEHVKGSLETFEAFLENAELLSNKSRQRRDEVVSAPWSEFNLSEGVWEIPAARSKNKRAHRVPLSSLACDLLNQVQELGQGSLWLFPSSRADGLMTPGAVTRAMHLNLSRLGIDSATPHDLRRTAASHMTEMGIQRLVVSKVLGHSDGSITAVYDRFEYGPQKKQALDAWSARLKEIITGKAAASNVVTLARAGEAK